MSAGRLIAVVGPSGVGKDSLIEVLSAADPGYHRVRRVISRPARLGGEDFEGVDETEFNRRLARGDFALWWDAHGLRYGIPCSARDLVAAGGQAVANLSRGALNQAAAVFAGLHVLSIMAAPEVLAQRLSARGREDRADIVRRLSRAAPPPPDGVQVTEIDNSGDLSRAVSAALAALQPVSGARRIK
ncbi:MAG: phosphonate metabolism protein/1,5-bisphosphokinase (PRPP-forming) PhnN [Rhodobacter sp.]|nr:phosphonate metabolism protein/1,5-bisphosphokinase (PRPP-forming) PhnN [Rhodobacter sp.]